MEIEFEDGVRVQTTRRRTYVSSFFWTVFLEFPEVKIPSNCHVQTILGSQALQSGTHGKLASNVYKAVANHLDFVKPVEREIVQRLVQVATNELYNELRENSGPHLQTIHLMDCITLMYHPQIWEACTTAEDTPQGIEGAYKVIRKVIDTDETVRGNGMTKATRSGAVKFNQVCQSIGKRGFPKEVNGRLFRVNAKSNYLFGIVNLYEFAADSRGSAEHLSATESPLQDSEYFSRRLQLQTCVVERVDYEDCGTTQTIPWLVRPAGYIESTGEFRKSDLNFLIGKIYVCPQDGSLKTIMGDEKHLESKVIQLRSPMVCEHPDPHAVCQVCMGKLANNHSRWANLGVVAATTMVSKISQRTLSTKHFVASGTGTGIVFSNELRVYFRRGPKNTDFVLQPDVLSWNPKLIVHRDDALGLVDVQNSDDIAKINPERITNFNKVRFVLKPPGNPERSDEMVLSQDKRSASMSIKMLEYIRKHGYVTDERNNFVIDLKDWNVDDVIFTLPDIQVSFSAYGNNIAQLIESSFDHLAERQSEDAPLKVLSQLVDMVTAKMDDINFATMELIVCGQLQAAPGNLSLGRLSSKPVMGMGKMLIWRRSLGTAMAYQQWDHLFLSPKTYQGQNKPSTMMDNFLDPRRYLTYHSKTYVNSIHRSKRTPRARAH